MEMMHAVHPKEASRCRSKGQEEERTERTYDYVVASGSLKGKMSLMEVVEDFESRTHKAVSSVAEREKEIKGMERAEDAKGAVRKEYKGEGREEGAVDEDGEEREVRSQIAQKVLHASEHDGEKEPVQRPVEQSFMRLFASRK